MTTEPLPVAVDFTKLLAYFDDGQARRIVALFDKYGEDTCDIDEAVTAKVVVSDGFFILDLLAFKRTLH